MPPVRESSDSARGRRQFLAELTAILAAGVMTARSSTRALGQIARREPPPQPGSVRLNNGLILRGMCSSTDRVTDGDLVGSGLELRLIDQGFRRIYVSIRCSEPAVVKPEDWPAMEFTIPQKRTGRTPMPDIITAPTFSPFEADGTATVTLWLTPTREETIRVGITKINELFAEVNGLTHQWTYQVPLKSIPAGRLYPGILERVTDFEKKPWQRLELVRMLMRAGLPERAGLLLDTIVRPDVVAEFPELVREESNLRQGLRTETGRLVLQELELRQASGQDQLALNAVRIFPENLISPETVLRARQLEESIQERKRRAESVRARLMSQAAALSPGLTALGSELIREISPRVSMDNVDRFAAFELLAGADGTSPENAIALAVSGWLMGSEESIQSLTEAGGLFEARRLIMDYLMSAPAEVARRDELTARITKLEGVSAERLARVIRQLPAVEPLISDRISSPVVIGVAAGRNDRPDRIFHIPETPDCMGCVGLVPPEFRTTRSYPVVVAFRHELITPENMVEWWAAQAERHGYVVVIPEAWGVDTLAYDATAEQHRRFLELMRRLKLGLRLDDDRIFVAGHGVGGEAAMDMATSHPDLFAGVISLGGLGRRHIQWTAHNEPSLPWYIVVGSRQGGATGYWNDRLELVLSKLFRRSTSGSRAISDVMFVKYPEYGSGTFHEETASLFEWMKLHHRKPFPAEINAQLLRSTDLSWSWLQLRDLPKKFTPLDQPTTWRDGEFQAATLDGHLTANNAIVIKTVSSAVTVGISRDLPGLDLQKPITVIAGRARTTVDFQPVIGDMLEQLRLTGERVRLCEMKVSVDVR